MTDEPRVLAVTWVPLSRAMFCLEPDCEAIFPLIEIDGDGTQITARALACPACGSEAFVPLGAWLRSTWR